MDVNDAIARNVKSIREKKKLTLDAASAITGVSRSMLSQIEKGEVNPTVSLLWKIANGYKVSFSSLTENAGGEVQLFRGADQKPLEACNGLYLNFPVFPFDEKTLFETYRIVIQPQGALDAQPHLRGAVEYITVFSGTVTIAANEKEFTLSKGDSLRFSADVPHSYRNSGDEEVQLSMLIYYGAV
jgi:transcriptional regulator with XRE-family HTH domain